ncbi:MAG TPA: hypothetical protein PLV45_13220, partial [bacterium]|nr:hypothetical protein [bacterium]
ENTVDPPDHFSIRRQFHFVYNNANNDHDNQVLGYKIFSRRGEILKEQLFYPRPSGGGNILGLKLIADSFSSIHVLYEVIETLPQTGLYWNSIKVLKNASGIGTNAFDVMDHPYDVSMVLQGAGTPVPDVQEFWVADMHGNRLIRVNQNQELLASTVVVEPQTEYEYSPLELCDVIAPSDVSACWDGSCWAIDWGRRSVVKVLSDGTLADRTECGLPYPKEIRDNMVQWPSAIDCAGDPNTCFVTDYEGGKVWKLTWNGTVLMTPTPSLVSYREPYAIAVQSGDVGGNPVDYIWVSDKYRMTPPPVGTATPIPSSTPVSPTPTPTPTVATGTPTYTPHPPATTPTPYPEHHRVTRNRFGQLGLDPRHQMAIPVNMSCPSDPGVNKCIISDRNSYTAGENRIRIYSDGVITEYPNDTIPTPNGAILRPADVEYVE